MKLYQYYYLFSITKGTFEFVTNSEEELTELMMMDEKLIELKDNRYQDFKTNEELYVGYFYSPILNDNVTLQYEIFKKSGQPHMIDKYRQSTFHKNAYLQDVTIYNKYAYQLQASI